jgi:hypothetical protein
MISKGNTHADGAKLGRYITTGKDGERAELWELRGFETENIIDAFRNVHVMATGTRCKQPFFHVQVRNPDGETMPRKDWERAANRIEAKLGLSGQPRAVAFHIDEKTGEQHMHVAWSRIDEDTLKAKPLPFFKLRLKEVSRELERELGLTIVTNERAGRIDYAPTRAEDEQARRLGVDIHAVRNTIRECYDRSDCGRAFEAALAEKGLLLAQGDRRDFVVIDSQGGMHAVGKRITGVSATKTRERFSDLIREHLPTVDQVRLHLIERQIENTKQQAMPDQDREEIRWQAAVAKAAIEKERVERRFVEPDEREGKGQGDREKKWPMRHPEPEQTNTSPLHHFEDAVREATRSEPVPLMPDKLKGTAAQIWRAYNLRIWEQKQPGGSIKEIEVKAGRDPQQFAAALEEKGIHLAVVSKDDAARSHRNSVFADELGNFAPRYREGEIVAVTEIGRVYQLNRRTTGADLKQIETFLKPLDRSQLQGVEATKETLKARVEQRTIEVQAFREMLRDTNAADRFKRATQAPKYMPRNRGRSIGGVLDAAFGAPAKALRALGPLSKLASGPAKLAEGILTMFDPILTPEQQKEKQIANRERDANAADTVDLSRYLADREQERRQRQEREIPRQRERERDR